MKNMKFRTKLVIIIVIVLIIQGVLIGTFSHYYATEIVMKNSRSNMAGMINLVDTNINTKVRYMTELIENTATSQTVRLLTQEGQKEENSLLQDTLVSEFFDSLDKSIGAVNSVMIIKPSGEVYFRKSGSKFMTLSYKEAESSEVYQKALASPGEVKWMGMSENIISGDVSNPAKKIISASCAITDESSGAVLGTVVVEMNPETFSTLLLNGQNIFQNQYTFIIDKNKEIICNNKSVGAGWVNAITSQFDKGSHEFDITLEGKKYYVCGQYNGLTGWETFSVIAKNRIFPESGTLQSFIMLFVLASTLITSFIIMVISYTMTRPINLLAKAMKNVQEEDFSMQIQNKRKDEIGKLIDSFNFMRNRINSLIKEVYQEKILQKNAEIKALEAQINPHFIYNTLDSINWMLIDKEEFEISEVIISLGNLLKYCVDKNSSLVLLAQEVSYVESYLIIQKNRLEEKLQYEISLPESLKQFRVPKLILQPLIENAIKHGIEPSKNGGLVKITVFDDADRIYIEVEDNGKGMDEKRLQQLEDYLNGENDELTNIGVNNVDKRIRLHYGEEYKIRILSEIGKGTRVTLTIPKDEEEIS